jgi:NhaP-type Na+/H+ or K+/H+ antiporter
MNEGVALLSSSSSSSSPTDPFTPRWQECLSIVGVFLLLTISFLSAKVIHKVKHLHFIPESGITMFWGLLFGLVIYLIGGSKAEAWLKFDTRIFDFILLPAIIFEGGYSLKKRGLFDNMATVILYAVAGTLISTVFIGFMLFVFAKFAHVASIGKYY